MNDVTPHDESLHTVERLQDWLDGRLSTAEASALQTHAWHCAVCASQAARLVVGRSAAREMWVDRPLPEGFDAELAVLLDREAETEHGADSAAPPRRPLSPPRLSVWKAVAALAAAAALVLGVWFGLRGPAQPDLPALAAADYAAVTGGVLPLGLVTSQPAQLEAHFGAAGAPRVRVLDLAMMGFVLEGGRAHTLGGRSSALYVYRTGSGGRLLCEMYEGTLAQLPPTEDVRQNGPFTFRVYTRGALTLVFWQEGDIVCVLVSDLPAAEVVQLAMAKAMLPA
jgi:anti-sigma factor RsiW